MDGMLQTLRNHYKQISRFSIVGVMNTLIDFSIFSLCFYILGFHVVVANICAVCLAIINSFLWNSFWTFKGFKKGRIKSQIFRFFLIALIGMVISTLIVYALEPYIPALLAKALAVVVTLGWNYCASWVWVFKER